MVSHTREALKDVEYVLLFTTPSFFPILCKKPNFRKTHLRTGTSILQTECQRCQTHLQQAVTTTIYSDPFACRWCFFYISKYCNSFTNHCGHLLTHTLLNLRTLPSMYKGIVKKTLSKYTKSKNRGHFVLCLSF